MATYRGPHVAVYQKFDITPPSVAIENLPPAIIGSAYEVYENEVLGKFNGIVSDTKTWPTDPNNTVIYDDTVIGGKQYDMYPVNVVVGNYNNEINSGVTISSNGIKLDADASYDIGVNGIEGVTTAYIPYYNAATPVTVSSDKPNTLNITNGAIRSARVTRYQHVYLYSDATLAWIYAGSVSFNPASENGLVVSNNVPAGTYSSIVIGCSYDNLYNLLFDYNKPVDTSSVGQDVTVTTTENIDLTQEVKAGDYIALVNSSGDKTDSYQIQVVGISSNKTFIKFETSQPIGPSYSGFIVTSSDEVHDKLIVSPNTIVDLSQDLSIVKVGDLATFKASDLTSEETASIEFKVHEHMIMFATTEDTTVISKFKAAQLNIGTTSKIDYYNVNRLVGFSDHNGDVGTYPRLTGDPETDTIDVTVYGKVPSAGDYYATALVGDPEPDTPEGTIKSVLFKGNNLYTITLENMIPDASSPANYKFYTWSPLASNQDVKVSFRATKASNTQTVFRIQGNKDIEDAFGKISPFNEIAYMLSNAYVASGNKVCYGVSVDPTDEDREYLLALDLLKKVDVYSLALGTTNSGINLGALPSHANGEADPYIGHERIGIATMDTDNIYYIGGGDGLLSDETLSGVTFNMLEPGNEVAIGDLFILKSGDNTGYYKSVTPPLDMNTIEIKHYEGDVIADGSVKLSVELGTESRKADRLSTLSVGERRLALVFPGWFTATYDNKEGIFPPYFISSVIAGLDSSNLPSQSLTNTSFAIPGMSNIKLRTDSEFGKLLLDEIGGAGIDIMVQNNAAVSQVIASRHDLTTNMDAIEYRERSITKQVDVVAKTMRAAVEPYRGKYNTTTKLLDFIRKIISITANSLVSNSIVKAINIESVSIDPEIKDKINIVLSVTVFVAGNYYDIILNVKS